MKVYSTLLNNFLLLTKIIIRPGCVVKFYFKWSNAYRFIFKTFYICTTSLYFICERILLDGEWIGYTLNPNYHVQWWNQDSTPPMTRLPWEHTTACILQCEPRTMKIFLHSHFESDSVLQVTFSSVIHFIRQEYYITFINTDWFNTISSGDQLYLMVFCFEKYMSVSFRF